MSEARRAVERLLAAGFTKDEISVLCSNETRQQYFHEFEHQRPGGKETPAAVVAGGAIGAAVGGLATLAAALATGGIALIFTGGVAIWSGTIVGGLVGAMMTRGVEKELADYYEQSVAKGKILVAAEIHPPESRSRLVEAEKIFADIGALPLTISKS